MVGSYGYIADNIWEPVVDVSRAILIGLSFLYCGYLVYNSNQPQIQAKKYEFLSLFAIGAGQSVHGFFHIFVWTFGVLHPLEDIQAAPESFEVYAVLTLETIIFIVVTLGFILIILNTIKNSDYRPEIKSNGDETEDQ